MGVVERQKKLAGRCEVQRGTSPNCTDHLHAGAFAVGPFHVHNFIALAHAQVHRLLDQLVQVAHGGQRCIAHTQACLDEVAQFQEAHAQAVAAGFRTVHKTAYGQIVQDAMRRGRVQARLFADLLERYRLFA
ncbi:hypothetical protein D3C72_1686900 [compost metagenome]